MYRYEYSFILNIVLTPSDGSLAEFVRFCFLFVFFFLCLFLFLFLFFVFSL